LPILAYSVNIAADSVVEAAYVVAISSSGCRAFLHVTFLSIRWGVATWVPFFDSGECLIKGRFTWGSYLKLTNFVADAIIFLAPISAFDQVLSEDLQVNRLVRSFYLVNFCWLKSGTSLLGGFCATVEGALSKQVAGQGRPRTVPEQMRYPPTQARVWHSACSICQKL
jgi:hypothetical protein